MLKILIIGLPGSGKTTLAKNLSKDLNAKWINADNIRKRYNDWDFSKEGILRQAKRMRDLSNKPTKKKIVICDFICPFEEGRKLFNPDVLIWMNTVKEGRFKKNSIDPFFQKPKKYDFMTKRKNAEIFSKKIIKKLNNSFLKMELG